MTVNEQNQIIQSLIKGIDKDNLNGEFFKNIDRENFWKILLEFMKEEGGADKLGHYPIWQNDLSADTLFQYINATADMDSKENPLGSYDFNKILDSLRGQINDVTGELADMRDLVTKNYPWNESLANALTYYLRFLDPKYREEYEKKGVEYTDDKDKVTNRPLDVKDKSDATHGLIPVSSGEISKRGGFRVTDVTNANAGNAFTEDSEKPWVIPNFNIDAETYDKVRGIDKILQVLSSHKEMQFTHTQDQAAAESSVNKYIRLLMPKYLRRVEVEDLNRNFWVIGQVITAISAYLFDEKSPVTEALKKILNELIQIWENILYLWAMIVILSQKPYYTKIHTEVVYISNDEYRDYYKFDDFAETATADLSEIWESRLSYLKDSYPECHLAIIPVIRLGNYRHNYYGKEQWPGAILYNRNTNEVTFQKFKSNIISIDSELSKRLYCIYEEENNFRYFAPFSKIGEDSGLLEEYQYRYTAAIRTRAFNIDAVFDADSNSLSLKQVSIYLEDAIAAAVTGTRTRVATLVFPKTNFDGVLTYTIDPYDNWTVDGKVVDQVQTAAIEKLKMGYYLGELISKTNLSQEFSYDITSNDIILRPIIPSVSELTAAGKANIASDTDRVLQSFTPTDQQISLTVGKSWTSLLKKEGVPEGYQPLGANDKIYLYSRDSGNVITIPAGEFGGQKDNGMIIQTYDTGTKVQGYTASGGLSNIISVGPKISDPHYTGILGELNPDDPSDTSYFLNPSKDGYAHGSIYRTYKDEGDSTVVAKKKEFLKPCRFTASQESFSKGAILKIGEQVNRYSDYELFTATLPRWSEFQPSNFLTKYGDQQCDMCETFAKISGVTHSSSTNKFTVQTGRQSGNFATAKFYYKKKDDHITKDNWVIEYVQVIMTFGPTMSNIARPAKLSDNSTMERTYRWDDSREICRTEKYYIGYKEAEWNSNGAFIPAYNSTIIRDGTKVTDIKYIYNPNVKNHTSVYAPYAVYGWPLSSTDMLDFCNMPVGRQLHYTPYWAKYQSDESLYPSIQVSMTNDLRSVLDNNSIRTNRCYFPATGMVMYPGWVCKVSTHYFYPDGTHKCFERYRLADNYLYTSEWRTTSGGSYISARPAELDSDYTLFKTTGDFTAEIDGKKQAFLDFVKYPANGVSR